MNLIYQRFLTIIEGDAPLHKIRFSKNPTEKPRYVEFYDAGGQLIDRLDLDLPHDEYMDMYREFLRRYRRIKNSNADGA